MPVLRDFDKIKTVRKTTVLIVAVVMQALAMYKWGWLALVPVWLGACLWLLWVGGGRAVWLSYVWWRLGRLLRIERRYWLSWRQGKCPACGYNLTGNTSGVCPECGLRFRETSA